MTTQELSALVEQMRSEQDIDAAALEPKKLGDELPAIRLLTPEQEAEREQRRLEIESQAVQQRRAATAEACFAERQRYRGCRLSNFEIRCDGQRVVVEHLRDYARHIVENVQRGRSVVLNGPPGTGKDHLVSALVVTAIHKDLRVVWKNGMDLFGEMRDRMDDERQSEASLVRSLVSPDVLVISDPLPPFGELSAYQASMLFRVIDGRYSAGKPTWITVNVASSEEARKRMGSQIVDRLRDGALSLPCEWESFRKPL